MRKVIAVLVAMAMFNLGMAYAFEQDKCISCSDENMELLEEMGLSVQSTEDGLIVTDETGREMVIDPQRNDGLCSAYMFCLIFTYWVAYGIFFIPCLIGYYGHGC